jgi:hypothetical protein
MKALLRIAAAYALTVAAAVGATVDVGAWYKFRFTGDIDQPVLPCIDPDFGFNLCLYPEDPPPPGFEDPPGVRYTVDNTWTLPALVGDSVLTVVDVFEQRDRFKVVIDATGEFFTSPPVNPDIDCMSNPVNCLATPGMSKGAFPLSGGSPRTFQIFQADSLLGSNEAGVGYFRIDAQVVVPEPGGALLIAAGIVGIAAGRRRVRACH